MPKKREQRKSPPRYIEYYGGFSVAIFESHR
jgi:hypothetical protein